MRRPKAILFDLDDTLISFDGVCDRAWEDCCGEFAAGRADGITKERLLEVIYAAKREYWRDPARHKAGRENLRLARREVVRMAFSGLGYDDTTADGLADRYTDLQDEYICLFPRTMETLDYIRAAGIRMGLLTNGASDAQRRKLTRFGLEDYFEVVLIDQEVGVSKPEPGMFQLALDRLLLGPGDAWMVGDNLVWDISGAKAVGIPAIWNDYKRQGLPPGGDIIPDRIVHDVGELKALLEADMKSPS